MIKSDKKGDIYISPRALGGITKMSLHRDGKCQIGFTADYPRHPGAGSRHWERWKLPAIPPPARVLRILIPQSELRSFAERHDEGLQWLPAPEAGAIGVVTLVLAPPDANMITRNGAELVGTLRTALRSAWVYYVRHAIDPALANVIASARARLYERYQGKLSPAVGTRSIWWSTNADHDRQVLELAYDVDNGDAPRLATRFRNWLSRQLARIRLRLGP